jgi:hypothetical protein
LHRIAVELRQVANHSFIDDLSGLSVLRAQSVGVARDVDSLRDLPNFQLEVYLGRLRDFQLDARAFDSAEPVLLHRELIFTRRQKEYDEIPFAVGRGFTADAGGGVRRHHRRVDDHRISAVCYSAADLRGLCQHR